jgi:polyisoprenoid-binding protein YceI
MPAETAQLPGEIMKVQLRHYMRPLALMAFAYAGENGPVKLDVDSGTASFESTTNVPGIEVKGKSAALSAHVKVTRDANGFAVDEIDATIPVKSLATGMKLRDEHMRKYIFTTAGGQTPDLRFEAGAATCPSSTRGFVCKLAGNLTIRGVSRPAELTLQAKEQSGSTLGFRVEGEGVVKLSDYGISAPSQFGVTPANEVKFRLEFSARQRSTVSRAGAAQ